MELHLALQTLTPDFPREKRQRRNKQQLERARAEVRREEKGEEEFDATFAAEYAEDLEIMRYAYGIEE